LFGYWVDRRDDRDAGGLCLGVALGDGQRVGRQVDDQVGLLGDRLDELLLLERRVLRVGDEADAFPFRSKALLKVVVEGRAVRIGGGAGDDEDALAIDVAAAAFGAGFLGFPFFAFGCGFGF